MAVQRNRVLPRCFVFSRILSFENLQWKVSYWTFEHVGGHPCRIISLSHSFWIHSRCTFIGQITTHRRQRIKFPELSQTIRHIASRIEKDWQLFYVIYKSTEHDKGMNLGLHDESCWDSTNYCQERNCSPPQNLLRLPANIPRLRACKEVLESRLAVKISANFSTAELRSQLSKR